jgi:hypothetical protein
MVGNRHEHIHPFRWRPSDIHGCNGTYLCTAVWLQLELQRGHSLFGAWTEVALACTVGKVVPSMVSMHCCRPQLKA